jgi:hypothetical protein
MFCATQGKGKAGMCDMGWVQRRLDEYVSQGYCREEQVSFVTWTLRCCVRAQVEANIAKGCGREKRSLEWKGIVFLPWAPLQLCPIELPLLQVKPYRYCGHNAEFNPLHFIPPVHASMPPSTRRPSKIYQHGPLTDFKLPPMPLPLNCQSIYPPSQPGTPHHLPPAACPP